MEKGSSSINEDLLRRYFEQQDKIEALLKENKELRAHLKILHGGNDISGNIQERERKTRKPNPFDVPYPWEEQIQPPKPGSYEGGDIRAL